MKSFINRSLFNKSCPILRYNKHKIVIKYNIYIQNRLCTSISNEIPIKSNQTVISKPPLVENKKEINNNEEKNKEKNIEKNIKKIINNKKKRRKRETKPSIDSTTVSTNTNPITPISKGSDTIIDQSKTATELLEKLQDIANIQKSLPSVDTVKEIIEKTPDHHDAIHLFDLYRKHGNTQVPESFLLPGIESCILSKNITKAINIAKDMLLNGRKLEEKTIRSLLDLCQEKPNGSEAIEVYNLMIQLGISVTKHDLQSILSICYVTDHLDGACLILKHLRQYTDIGTNTYMHWLHRAQKQWRADVFFDILIEMRHSKKEVKIPSLTSLQTGKEDYALTVMEGIRAVGLDPHFAMALVVDSMFKSVHNKKRESIPKQLISKATKSFGKKKVININWETRPVPQLIETQAAGLLLSVESFHRLQYKEVIKIEEYLKLLPMNANISINLRKQLQKMSLIINTQRIRSIKHKIKNEFETEGKSLSELSTIHNYPPVSLMRIILEARGKAHSEIKKIMDEPDKFLSKRETKEIVEARKNDSIYRNDPVIFDTNYRNPETFEKWIVNYVRSLGIRIATEEDLIKEQENSHFGRAVLSPDILFLDPVTINGVPIRWIDAKCYYGSHLVTKHLAEKQISNYVHEWGPGAVVYSMGFSDMLSIPGVLCLDTTPIPKSGYSLALMNMKATLYTIKNSISTNPTLSTELSQQYQTAKELWPEKFAKETTTFVTNCIDNNKEIDIKK